MKFGVREICDVVLKAKANQKIGNKIFYKNEPVIYFDTLKTSSMEGAATTVYAQGGRGNSRLVAWEGERTVTFTMEDALISPAGFMILSGAGLIEAGSDNGKGGTHTVITHTTEQVQGEVNEDGTAVSITLAETPYKAVDADEDYVYVMFLDDGEVVTEPFIPSSASDKVITISIEDALGENKYPYLERILKPNTKPVVLVDYYVERASGAQQIDITPDKFGGNYYLEASTLFRQPNGVDMPAEFIIPNCKIQSNFTFTMASSGDPSTFTFTMDAFPDYTRFNRSKKVLAAIQIIGGESENADPVIREHTPSKHVEDPVSGEIKDNDNNGV